MCVKWVSHGLTFRQVEGCANALFKETLETRYKSINRQGVSGNMQIHCARSYHIISRALSNVWAFSIAVDGANKSGMPYLDIRVRFVLEANLFNLHLIVEICFCVFNV